MDHKHTGIWAMLLLVLAIVLIALWLAASPAYGKGFVTAGYHEEGDTRQTNARAGYTRKWTDIAELQADGKLIRTTDKPTRYDIGFLAWGQLTQIWRADTAYRHYDTHDTMAAGLGIGRRTLTVTAGVRVDYVGGRREANGRLAATASFDRGPVEVRLSAEELYRQARRRLDYKGSANLHAWKHWTAGVFVEHVRGADSRGLEFGYSF